MFGVVPRVVWTRSIQPDDRNRIALRHNCLLLETVGDDAGLGRPRRVVIETGTGDKLDEKMRAIFGLEDRTVETAVREAGLDPGVIDDVVVSHLHFDHAGGLTRACRDGEEPDWIAGAGRQPLATDRVKLTFPNATIHVQAREWADALANRSVMTRTYYLDHLEPIADRVRLVDSPRPFPLGVVPERDELPRTPVEYRMTEVLPGIRVFLAPGHTWGQQAILFEDDRRRTVVFTPDVIPSVHHVGAAYSLAYDVESYTSMVTKRWFLDAAATRNWLLVLDHEPGAPLQRVGADGRGWFALRPDEG